MRTRLILYRWVSIWSKMGTSIQKLNNHFANVPSQSFCGGHGYALVLPWAALLRPLSKNQITSSSGHFACRGLSYSGTTFACRFHDLARPKVRKFTIFYVVDAWLLDISGQFLWIKVEYFRECGFGAQARGYLTIAGFLSDSFKTAVRVLELGSDAIIQNVR